MEFNRNRLCMNAKHASGFNQSKVHCSTSCMCIWTCFFLIFLTHRALRSLVACNHGFRSVPGCKQPGYAKLATMVSGVFPVASNQATQSCLKRKDFEPALIVL